MSASGDREELARLRESYLAAIRADAEADATETAPDAAVIWDAVSGELPADRRREVVDRVATSPAWAEAWRLAVEMHDSIASGEAAVPGAGEARRRFWNRFGILAAAASVVVLVGGGLLVREVLAPGPVYRSPGDDAIQSRISEDLPVPRDDLELRWSPAEAGSRYDVTVTTESLRLVATARDLEQPRFVVPPEALADLSSGAKLLWRVTARTPEGAEIRSPTFIVTVQ